MSNSQENSRVEVVKLSEWLDRACGKDEQKYVALPMIQRGSVWKPEKIIDLWDCLLRGMPIGSFMLNTLKKGTIVRRLGKKESEKLETDGKGLLDGQQRTLAMLLAWQLPIEANKEIRMDKRVWVDFLDSPGNAHLYRLRITTENHKFGFRRDAPSSRLSLQDRSNAHQAYEKEFGEGDVLLDKAKPYVVGGRSLALDLYWLIQQWRKLDSNKDQWVETVKKELEKINGFKKTDAEVEKRVEDVAESFVSLFKVEIPLITISDKLFDIKGEKIEPALAVLFKRIGTGGQQLSNADYAYSIIKHNYDKTYDLVEELMRDRTIAAVLSETDLVMTALRLLAAETYEPITDYENPDKTEFHHLWKNIPDLEKRFLALIDKDGGINSSFEALHDILLFNQENNSGHLDIGLPLQAFPLLKRPLVQVLLRWIRLQILNGGKLSDSRDEIIRFAMFWLLCVPDAKKASIEAYKFLKNPQLTTSPFLGREIYKHLIEKKMAVALQSPEALITIVGLIKSEGVEEADKPLRGWGSRFADQKEDSDEIKSLRKLYARWWNKSNGYSHPLLLWLQREYVSEAFKNNDPLAGRDEETPYDYDHICPASHWYDGRSGNIKDFCTNGAYWCIGNSIGNLRVWKSSDNRSWGNEPHISKLGLDKHEEETTENCNKLLDDSVILQTNVQAWKDCSPKQKPYQAWDRERAIAFQQAVEERAFDLYKKYFNELGFAEWLNNEDEGKKE